MITNTTVHKAREALSANQSKLVKRPYLQTVAASCERSLVCPRPLSSMPRFAIASLLSLLLHFAFASLHFVLRFTSNFKSKQIRFGTPHADGSAGMDIWQRLI